MWRSLPVPVCHRISRFERRTFKVSLVHRGDRELEGDLLTHARDRREIHAPNVEPDKRNHVTVGKR